MSDRDAVSILCSRFPARHFWIAAERLALGSRDIYAGPAAGYRGWLETEGCRSPVVSRTRVTRIAEGIADAACRDGRPQNINDHGR